MEGKFLGMGLKNLLGIWILFTIFSLVAKVVFTKYEIPGVSEIFIAA